MTDPAPLPESPAPEAAATDSNVAAAEGEVASPGTVEAAPAPGPSTVVVVVDPGIVLADHDPLALLTEITRQVADHRARKIFGPPIPHA